MHPTCNVEECYEPTYKTRELTIRLGPLGSTPASVSLCRKHDEDLMETAIKHFSTIEWDLFEKVGR
jgi:hypothetical protein